MSLRSLTLTLPLLLFLLSHSLAAQDYFRRAYPDVSAGESRILDGDNVAILAGIDQFFSPAVFMLNSNGDPVGNAWFTPRPDFLTGLNVAARKGGGYFWLVDEAANTANFSAYSNYIFDENNNPVRHTTYRSDGGFFDIREVISKRDGGAVLVGSYFSFNQNDTYGLMLEVDIDGAVVSARGFDEQGSGSAVVIGGMQTPDGGMFYVGRSATASQVPGEGSSYVHFFKVNAAGDLEWSKRYLAEGNIANFGGGWTDVVTDNENNIWVLTRMSAMSSPSVLLKFANEGTEAFAETVFVPSNELNGRSRIFLAANGRIGLFTNTAVFTADVPRSNGVCLLDNDGEVLESWELPYNNSFLVNAHYRQGEDGYWLVGEDYVCDSVIQNIPVVSYVEENFGFGSADCEEATPLEFRVEPYSTSVTEIGNLLEFNFYELVPPAPEPFTIGFSDISCPVFNLQSVDDFTLSCTVETLNIPFITNAEVSRDGTNIRSFTLRLNDGDGGALFLPPGFPVTVTGNGTSEITITTNFAASEAEIAGIARAIEYRAPDFLTLDGPHEVTIVYAWTCGEESTEPLTFTVNSPPIFPGTNQTLDTIICFPDTLTLTAQSPLGAEFSWSTGATTRAIVVAQPGLYVVTVSNFCGADSASFELIENTDPPLTGETVDYSLCPGDSVTYTAPPAVNTSSEWSDGISGSERTFLSPGIYLLTRRNTCSEATTTVTVLPLPAAPDFGDDRTRSFCEGASVDLEVTRFPETDYTWSTGSDATTISVNEQGEYLVVATNVCGVDSQLFTVAQSSAEPLPDLREDFRLCFSDSVRFRPPNDGAALYRWENGSTDPWRTFRTAGDFFVSRTNECFSGETRVVVAVRNCCEVYLPTAFSPNEDGLNDILIPLPNPDYCPTEEFEMAVFDRWGGERFRGPASTGWDGNAADGKPAGVGVYTVIYAYSDGERKVTVSELVTLMR